MELPIEDKEIAAALKEFEEKSAAEEEKFKQQQAPSTSVSDTPKIVDQTMKYSGGLIKDERQAEYALLALVILMILVSLFFFFGGGIGKKNVNTVPVLTGPNVILK